MPTSNVQDLLLNILVDPVNGLKVLDDSVPPRTLVCTYKRPMSLDMGLGTGVVRSNDDIDRNSTLWILKHPTPLERDPMISVPMVVLGPEHGGIAEQSIGYALSSTELSTQLEVRILTRDVDESQQGWRTDGHRTRRKIAFAMRNFVQANAANPGGTGQFLYMRIAGPVTDQDERQPNPLYQSTFNIEVVWFE